MARRVLTRGHDADELRTAMSEPKELPPPARLFQLLSGYMMTQSLAVAARLGIADILATGPHAVADLARRTGANEDALFRVLRALASVGVFTQVAPRTFAQTPTSSVLAESSQPSMKHLAILFGSQLYRAWGAAESSVMTGTPAFERVFGAKQFDYLESHPEEHEIFTKAMSGQARGRLELLASIDWSAPQRVVDVGGGDGTLLAGLLAKHPHLEGVVFELPELMEAAGANLEKAGLSQRASCVGGSFLTDPLPAGDTFVLARVLHNWDDDRAREILRRCSAAMSDHGRVVIFDDVISEEGDAFETGKLLDLAMLVILGGRERNRTEWAALLESAGLTLQLARPAQNGGLVVATKSAGEQPR